MSGNGFSGLISEVRFYGARLTDEQEAAVGQELATKYGATPSAYGTPKALPGRTLALTSATLNISTNFCDPALSTVQSNQTLSVTGVSKVNGVLCVGAGATLAVTSVTDSLTVSDLAFQNGATLAWKYESKSSTPIHVTGDLALPSRFRLDLTGSSGTPSRVTPIITYDGSATVPIEGVTVVVVGATKAGTKAVVVPSEKRVILMSPSGTLITVK